MAKKEKEKRKARSLKLWKSQEIEKEKISGGIETLWIIVVFCFE